jgi:transcriptional regulator with XRE-family HTH domain
MRPLRRRFAQRLKDLRLQRGMTQTDLALAAGLSVGFIRAMEQAVHAPSFESLEALANALEIEARDLFDFD